MLSSEIRVSGSRLRLKGYGAAGRVLGSGFFDFGFGISARPGATAWKIYTHCRDTCECDFLNLAIINQVWARPALARLLGKYIPIAGIPVNVTF
jgi:hypothetical protein